jgi:hypothetical protein
MPFNQVRKSNNFSIILKEFILNPENKHINYTLFHFKQKKVIFI